MESVSINDGYDSIQRKGGADDIVLPFKNLVNDAYCRDISVKIRSQLEVKRKKGDFIGSFAVYGYLKDPDDRHKLVIDEYAADVVRDIFKWKLEGLSQQRIAERLDDQGILSPMEYKRYCGMKYKSGFQINPKARWTAVAIDRILKNQFYVGTLVQGKRSTPNHKIKKLMQKPENEWVCIEHNHEPIIEREIFDTVNRLLMKDTRIAPQEQTVYLFSGLLFCGDCRRSMVRNNNNRGGKIYTYYKMLKIVSCLNKDEFNRAQMELLEKLYITAFSSYKSININWSSFPYTTSFKWEQCTKLHDINYTKEKAKKEVLLLLEKTMRKNDIENILRSIS